MDFHQQKNTLVNIYIPQIELQRQTIKFLEEKLKESKTICNKLFFENGMILREKNSLLTNIQILENQISSLQSEYIKNQNQNQIFQSQILVLKNEVTNLCKANKQLKQENIQLKNSIDVQNSKIQELNSVLSKLKHEINQIKQKEMNYIEKTKNLFLDEHYQNSINNVFREKNYFPETIKDIFTIISYVGKSWYNILQQLFNLPNYRTTQRYRNKFLQKYGLTVDVFDGEMHNLKKLKDLFTKEEDLRYVIAIDAVSLTSYVNICDDGTVKGLKVTKQIPVEQAKFLICNENEFKKFVRNNKYQLENYVFSIYLCSLNPNMKSFPIVLVSDSKGNCTNEILNILIQTKQKLIELGFDIEGYSFDGDLKYFDLLSQIFNKIIDLNNYDFSLSLYQQSFLTKDDMMFSDPLHLLKCARYRFVNDTPIFSFLTSSEPKVTRDSFSKIGIPYYILDPHKSKKMEDNLPKKLFQFKYLKEAKEHNEFELYFSLYPFVMLSESIFNDNFSIENRYKCLERGYCFVLIYTICLNYYNETKNNDTNFKKNLTTNF